jgi:NAD(P)-dependent dehydrogenase (short-subunit alcohol dehydrogenase family)
LADKAALITGGSSGIGLAVARALGEDGYGVTIAARRPDKLEQAAAELRDAGLDVLHVAANMVEEDDIKRMIEAHRERFGRLDVLMNNAGLGIGGLIESAETKKLDMQLDVNTASIAGKQPQGWLAAYSATKAAVIALTEATGKELANDGVRCTAICPGFVDTPMTDWARSQGVPGEEMIRPEDIAEIVMCLLRLSPAAIVPEVMIVRPQELASGGAP